MNRAVGVKLLVFCLGVIGVALVVAALFLSEFYVRDDGVGSLPPAHKEGSGGTVVDQIRIPHADTSETNTSSQSLPESGQRAALKPKGPFITGSVRDLQTDEPIRLFDFELKCRDRVGIWRTLVHETIRHEEGRFRFFLQQPGRVKVVVRSNRYCRKELPDMVVPADQGIEDLVIRLDPGFVLAGEVFDAKTALPVEGALVLPHSYRNEDDLAWLSLGYEAYGSHALSDENGGFLLEGLDWDDYPYVWTELMRIAVVHPDYAVQEAFFTEEGQSDIFVGLSKGACLYGRVLDDQAQPAAGVMISYKSNDFFAVRSVLSGPDGYYRTAPVPPGWIYLRAGPPPDRPESFPFFTEEERTVHVETQDLRVDFGPGPEHLIWRGTLVDPDGQPIRAVNIHLHRLIEKPEEGLAGSLIRAATTDAEGRFEFKKLLCATYRVNLYLSQPITHIRWGDIVLDRKGMVEKEIRLTGSKVEGEVLDSLTGRPLQKRRGSIDAFQQTGDYQVYNTQIDPEGRFRFLYLPEGEYDLRVRVQGFLTKTGIPLTVLPDQPVRDLEIVIPSGGHVRFKVWGFEHLFRPRFKLDLQREGSPPIHRGIQQVDARGLWKEEQDLETGTWKISVQFDALGFLERSFDVVHGETVDVVIHRNDLVPRLPALTVNGSVQATDRSPMSRLRLRFQARNVAGLDEEGQSRFCVTNEEGLFSLPGLRSGRWEVCALLDAGREIRFPDLVIPESARDVFDLNLLFPSGEVSGRLFDEKTGAPFLDFAPRWWIGLQDIVTSREVFRIEGGRTGSAFELKGVPAGRYRLNIVALGYFDFSSSVFQLEAGQTLDLGRISLAPCGVLDITVFDRAGDPILSPHLSVEGKIMTEESRQYLGPGRYRYYKMPVDPAWIVVEADGYSPGQCMIDLDPGTPHAIEMVLDSQ